MRSFTYTSFTTACILLDRTYISLCTFTNSSFTNLSTIYWKTNVSIGSFTSTTFTNACTLLDRTNTSLNTLQIVVLQTYPLFSEKQMFLLECSLIQAM